MIDVTDAPLTGDRLYRMVEDLFPICRSLTGDGTHQTLLYFQNILPDLIIRSVPSGITAYDWTVPDEWNIRDAYIETPDGQRIARFADSNLHVVGYSEPVDRIMEFEELSQHLHSLPDQPDAIPYVTSYYQRNWGFCLSDRQRKSLKAGPYRAFIDSSLAPGEMRYGELVLPGDTEQEILLSTYCCHPSLANNELSGPCVAVAVAAWLAARPRRRYTYRILFLVETIGAIVYISQNLEEMQKNIIAGFVLSCLGDDRDYSYLSSRNGATLADRVAIHVLRHFAPEFKAYSYLDRGSDERQYCSPGVDLPVCSLMRTKYGEYPEYHTSLDNMDLISPEGLQGGFDVVRSCIELIEMNEVYRCTTLCEPQLGKRGLYPILSTSKSREMVHNIVNVLGHADGTKDLIDLCNTIGVSAFEIRKTVEDLVGAGLMRTE